MPAFRPIFIILGYGVPDDPATDGNYNRYADLAYKFAGPIVGKFPNARPLVLPAGGATAMRGDLQRTEAQAMEQLFQARINADTMHHLKRGWEFQRADGPDALSTVGDLLEAKSLIEDESWEALYVLCEFTRQPRIRQLAATLFGIPEARTIGLDFDQSPERHADQQHREQILRQAELAVLHDPVLLEQYNELFRQRLGRFRACTTPEQWQRVLDEHVENLRRLVA